MTAEDAFLVAIREQPDDTPLRLVYADWLEDRNSPGDAARAEFIRLQCLGSGLSIVDDPLRSRAEELLRSHWDAWVRPLARLLGNIGQTDYWLRGDYRPEGLDHFRRGFITSLSVDTRRFLEQAPAILRLAPVETLRLFGAGGLGGRLARCAHLVGLRRLDFADYFRNPVGEADVAALADSPYLDQLRMLSLYRNHLGDAGASALARASWLGSLEALELGENSLSAAGMLALGGNPDCQPRRLRLGLNPLGDEGASVLVASPLVRRVQVLALYGCGIGPAGAAVLAQTPLMPALEWLDVQDNPLGEEGQRQIEQLVARKRVCVNQG